jgi:hypothetical protein
MYYRQAKVVDRATGNETKIQCGSSKRMAVQQAVMVETKMGNLPDCNKWNVDASTMIIEDTGKGSVMYRFVSCEEADECEDKLLKNPLTSNRFQQGLDMALKWMQLGNGIGDFGTMVLIVATPGMPEGRFFKCVVQGLSFEADSTKTGVIYFTKTRCMSGVPGDDPNITNPWSDYFQGIFYDDITRYAEAYNRVNVETGELLENCCSIDGESCVNRELLTPSVFEKLGNANIELFKCRPSCTETDNPLDACDNFRDKNVGLTECVKKNTNTANEVLERSLDSAFKALKLAFPDVTMSAHHFDKAKTGICRFVYVCKEKYVSPGKQVVGFQRSFHTRVPGIDLRKPILGRENSTVDAFNIINKLCRSRFTDSEMNHIWDNFPEMISITTAQGRLSNEEMDRLHICNLPEDEFKDRDTKCLAQQGPVDLTHAETRKREAAYLTRKERAANQKKIDDAHQLIEKENRQKAVAEAKKKEKERVNTLTPLQKKEDPACIEAVALANRNKEKKQLNAEKKAQSSRSAKLLIANAN